MKARGLLGVLACAVALIAVPAAQATPSYFVKPKALHLSASLPASDGYAASIVTTGHQKVVLTFFQGSYQITYTTLGKVTRRGISADFGRLGHISLRFRTKRRPEALPLPFLMRECKGRKVDGGTGRLRRQRSIPRRAGIHPNPSQRVKARSAVLQASLQGAGLASGRREPRQRARKLRSRGGGPRGRPKRTSSSRWKAAQSAWP